MAHSRVLSGVQPTGQLHLGNYLGAIKNWVALQKKHEEALFCIVDLHAITIPQDPSALRKATLETAAAYIACGIDPQRSIIFNQSAVPQHAELAWILGCHTPIGWLNRMTQFKEKAGKNREKSGLGLYSYPVLMAADILLYQATHIPVGDDQKQHLELTRNIAERFNQLYETDFFVMPEPIIMGGATRIMSLRDGTRKMSKSEPSDQSRIHLSDDVDTIAAKIKKSKSDMEAGITYDVEKRPETSNLLTIYAAITDTSIQQAEQQFHATGFAEFKKELADAMVAHLSPISAKMQELLQDQTYLEGVLRDGAARARELAEINVAETKEILGFLSA